jgi:mono/diheme cytochrome c family protein
MTQVPDYLLQRSAERRAALGLPPYGSSTGAAAPPAAQPAGEAPEGEAAAVPATAGEAAPVPAAAAAPPAPAIAEPEVPAYVPPLPAQRSGIPSWVVPVLAILPIWAFAYVGALSPPSTGAPILTPIQQGAQLFAKNCSPCHGANGEGGIGPKLAGGEAKLTFPNEADHIAWVDTGSITKAKGLPYGDPNRPGGQHTVKVAGMPPFKGTLTDDQIKNVVTFERDGLK